MSPTIDLLYRVAEGKELTSRTPVYATQGAAYTRAVQEALGLPALPRFEFWFLAAGEVV